MTHTVTEHGPFRQEAADNSEMHVFDLIVWQSSTKDCIGKIIDWYGYTAGDDTAKPSNNMPGHFIKRYRIRLKRQTRTGINVNKTTEKGITC